MDKPNKPLMDWTLQELSLFCDNSHCNKSCPFYYSREDSCTLMENPPSGWSLIDWPKYTADEVALAKLLMKAGAVRIGLVDGAMWSEIVVDYSTGHGMTRGSLPGAAFPSLLTNMWVDLKDIAESEVAP